MVRRNLNELKLDPEDEFYRILVYPSDTKNNTYAKFIDQSGHLHRRLMNDPIKFDVDHINGDTLDNRKINLRVISHAENCRNKDASARSPCGHQGVRHLAKLNKYEARITHNYKELYIGVFFTLEEAIQARLKKEKELWGIQPRRSAAFNDR